MLTSPTRPSPKIRPTDAPRRPADPHPVSRPRPGAGHRPPQARSCAIHCRVGHPRRQFTHRRWADRADDVRLRHRLRTPRPASPSSRVPPKRSRTGRATPSPVVVRNVGGATAEDVAVRVTDIPRGAGRKRSNGGCSSCRAAARAEGSPSLGMIHAWDSLRKARGGELPRTVGAGRWAVSSAGSERRGCARYNPRMAQNRVVYDSDVGRVDRCPSCGKRPRRLPVCVVAAEDARAPGARPSAKPPADGVVRVSRDRRGDAARR